MEQVLTMLSHMTSIPLEDLKKEQFERFGDSEALRTVLSDFLLQRFENTFDAVDESKASDA